MVLGPPKHREWRECQSVSSYAISRHCEHTSGNVANTWTHSHVQAQSSKGCACVAVRVVCVCVYVCVRVCSCVCACMCYIAPTYLVHRKTEEYFALYFGREAVKGQSALDSAPASRSERLVAVVDQRVAHLVEIAPGGIVVVGRPTYLVRSLFSRVVGPHLQPRAVLPFPLCRKWRNWRP